MAQGHSNVRQVGDRIEVLLGELRSQASPAVGAKVEEVIGLLVESVEAERPVGAPADWQPGAVLRLPFSKKLCRDGGVVCPQALMALADAAMVLACSAAWNGYRAMTTVDQTMHFLRPVTFDVVADARIVRIGRSTSFGRAMLLSAPDKRPVGMASSAYAML